MKLFKLNILAGVALAALCASASAVPVFQITPTVIGGTAAPTSEDQLGITSSELIHISGATQTVNFGWAQVTDYSLNGHVTGATTADLLTHYNLYLTFNLVSIAGNLQSLNYLVYADPQFDDAFNNPGVVGGVPTGTEASVSGQGNDVLLGTGALLFGTTVLNSGGVALNSTGTFGLCAGGGHLNTGGVISNNAACTSADGVNFFSAPVPFYSIAIDEYNNTSAVVSLSADGSLAAIIGAKGSVNFNNVPEPASLALAGIALLGLGLASKRKRQA